MEWIVVKTFLSLGAVIAVMIGVVFVMKKYVYGRSSASSSIVEMKVIGTLMVQPKRVVSVLKVMNKVLIIGVTEDGMQTLGEIDDEQSLARIEERLAEQPGSSTWFRKKAESSPVFSFANVLKMQLAKVVAKGS
jgi:flagellar biogenesis protein FliO